MWEVGLKTNTVDSVLLYAGKEVLVSGESEDTATALFAFDEACVDGRAADEAVTAVDCTRDGLALVQRSTDDQRLVDDFLVSNSMRKQNLSFDTACRAAERQRRIGERSTLVSVDAAAIAVVPESCPASQSYRRPIIFYIGGKGGFVQDQGERENPADVEDK